VARMRFLPFATGRFLIILFVRGRVSPFILYRPFLLCDSPTPIVSDKPKEIAVCGLLLWGPTQHKRLYGSQEENTRYCRYLYPGKRISYCCWATVRREPGARQGKVGKGKEDGHQVICCIPTAYMCQSQHPNREPSGSGRIPL
jgi:hypothetical protein